MMLLRYLIVIVSYKYEFVWPDQKKEIYKNVCVCACVSSYEWGNSRRKDEWKKKKPLNVRVCREIGMTWIESFLLCCHSVLQAAD